MAEIEVSGALTELTEGAKEGATEVIAAVALTEIVCKAKAAIAKAIRKRGTPSEPRYAGGPAT